MNREHAFPTFTMTESGNLANDGDGMLLLDYFAAQAMQGFLANRDFNAFKYEGDDLLAGNAYQVAGAMLEARTTFLRKQRAAAQAAAAGE